MTDHDLILEAFQEDIPDGDLTTDSLGKTQSKGYAFLIAKSDLILSGQDMFENSLRMQAPDIETNWYFQDSDPILKGQKVCSIKGNLIPVLKAERVALNFLGYLSGIATTAHVFMQACQGSNIKILDTRKTLPGYRRLVKKAVVDGGAHNHRMNLSDAVLIKENHIRLAGSISNAVETVRSNYSGTIEVEASTLEDVKELVELNVERILLDNMDNETLQKALELIPEGIETEASGNMNLSRVRELTKFSNLNYISVGAITHSAPCADFSLLFEWPDENE